MYGDQSGEIGCRYWGLEGQGWEAQYNEYVVVNFLSQLIFVF